MYKNWRWSKNRSFAVIGRRNRIRSKIIKRNLMNNFFFPIALLPVFAISLFFMVANFIIRPVQWVLSPFRKIIAAAVAGGAGVLGVYWTEIFPYNNDLIKISYEVYIYIKYVMTGVVFALAFMISSDLYKD